MANINNLVLLIITPIIYEFKRRTGRKKVKLQREKNISGDSETGGYEGSVVDAISLTEEKYFLIVEAKEESLSTVMWQCLLALKDMGHSNHGSVIYSFVTIGDG